MRIEDIIEATIVTMNDLTDVLGQETRALDNGRLLESQAFTDRKIALIDRYARQHEDLSARKADLSGIDGEQRTALREILNDSQDKLAAATQANLAALEEAHRISSLIVGNIVDAARADNAPAPAYTRGGRQVPTRSTQRVSVALNQNL